MTLHVGCEREEELRVVPTDGLLMWQEGISVQAKEDQGIGLTQ